jgi:hypothetical protein
MPITEKIDRGYKLIIFFGVIYKISYLKLLEGVI